MMCVLRSLPRANVWASGNGGPATQAELTGPSDVAVDASGDLFIADTGNAVIQEVAPAPLATAVTVMASSRPTQ